MRFKFEATNSCWAVYADSGRTKELLVAASCAFLQLFVMRRQRDVSENKQRRLQWRLCRLSRRQTPMVGANAWPPHLRNVKTFSQNQKEHAWQLLHHVTLDFVGSTATSCEETCARGRMSPSACSPSDGPSLVGCKPVKPAGMSCRSGDEASSWGSSLFES